MLRTFVWLSLAWLIPSSLAAQSLALARQVAGQYIRDTPLDLVYGPPAYPDGMEVIQWPAAPGRAYALTYLPPATEAQRLLLYCQAPLRIWLDNDRAYARTTARPQALRETAGGTFTYTDTVSLPPTPYTRRLLVEIEVGPYPARLAAHTAAMPLTTSPFAPELRSERWLCLGPLPVGSAIRPEQHLHKLYPGTQIAWMPPLRQPSLHLRTPDSGSPQDWHEAHSLALQGMMALAQATGDDSYAAYARQHLAFLFDHYDYFAGQYGAQHQLRGDYYRFFRGRDLAETAGAGLPLVMACAAGNCPPGWAAAIDRIAACLADSLPRRQDGTYCQHLPEPGSVCAEDLYRSVPFLLHLARMRRDKTSQEAAVQQLLQMSAYLFDPEKKLYFHGWLGRQHLHSGVCWARSNGYAAWALIEALELLSPRDPRYHELMGIYRSLMQALAQHQDDSGRWRQVLDYSGAPLESGASAMFVMALARGVNRGWLPGRYKRYAAAGWDALAAQVSVGNRLQGVGPDLPVSVHLTDYLAPVGDGSSALGTGAFLLAAIEVAQLK
ncbi:MAG: hypothetical protein OHK0039_07560 [Bacteroidia bacterium]